MPLAYGEALMGRARVRLRETYLRDHVAPLLAQGAPGAVKLDLALRGLAGTESAPSGRLAPEIDWEALHDLVRPAAYLATDRVLKRKWVNNKLGRLEQRGLVRRVPRPGSRPAIEVLRDDGSGLPVDDPGGVNGQPYATFL